MPHITVEYTHDLQANIAINTLLPALHHALLSHDGVFSAPGIRSRAVMLNDYHRGTGHQAYGFVHVTLKILTGRSEAVKQKVLDHLYEVINQHLKTQFNNADVALSLELFEFNTGGNMYKQN